nr:SDR family NAD(P)-dependent oxidoreductase [Nesterenkonia sp. PF2B19]
MSKDTRGADVLLEGKTAIVTGSGAGLGLAYAQELARHGAAVVVNDVDAEAAASAVASIRSEGGRAAACVAPVGSAEAAEQLVSTAVEEFGGLDILVTNAGILRDRSLLKMSDEDFDAVIDVHLRGTFTTVRAAYAHFKAQQVRGRIICIGSPTGQRGTFGQTNYAAAKAGIVGMVRTWALEMRRSEVCVNAVIPVAATAMTKTVPYFQKAVEADERGEPMPDFFRKTLGFGTADDVAGLIAFLASDQAQGISGQAIGIGGDRLQLWSHPEPVVEELHDGGWTVGALQEAGRRLIEADLQPVGESMPELPESLRPDPA